MAHSSTIEDEESSHRGTKPDATIRFDNGLTADGSDAFGNDSVTALAYSKWTTRDSRLGTVIYPNFPRRVYYYMDVLQDIQGPFTREEMRMRVLSFVINENTRFAFESGIGNSNMLIDSKVCDTFPSLGSAFAESSPMNCVAICAWTVIGIDGREYGPFNNTQMLIWFKSGFFRGSTNVRLCSSTSGSRCLNSIYEDPRTAFVTKPRISGVPETFFKDSNMLDIVSNTITQELNTWAERCSDASKNCLPLTTSSLTSSTDGPATSSGSSIIHSTHSRTCSYDVDNLMADFCIKPLQPADTLLRCFVRKVAISNLPTKYIFFLEENCDPIMVAVQKQSFMRSWFDIYFNESSNSIRDNFQDSSGYSMTCYASGSLFLLHSNSLCSNKEKKTGKDYACMFYETKKSKGNKTTRLKVALPIIDSTDEGDWPHDCKDKSKQSKIVKALKCTNDEDLIVLESKALANASPRSQIAVPSSAAKKYELFQSQDGDSLKGPVLQFEQTGASRFAVSSRHPLGLMQTFAIALSTIYSTKVIT